jgi:hypothetical protein
MIMFMCTQVLVYFVTIAATTLSHTASHHIMEFIAYKAIWAADALGREETGCLYSSWNIFFLHAYLGLLKNPMTSLGIEPVTFQLVA